MAITRGTGVLSRTGWGMVAGVQQVQDGLDASAFRYTFWNIGCAVTLPPTPGGHRLVSIKADAVCDTTLTAGGGQGGTYRLVVIAGDLPTAVDPYQDWNNNAAAPNWPQSLPRNFAGQLPAPVLFDHFYQIQFPNNGNAYPAGFAYPLIVVEFNETGPSVPEGQALTIMFLPVHTGGNGNANPSSYNYHALGAYGISGPGSAAGNGQSPLGSASAALPRFDVAARG